MESTIKSAAAALQQNPNLIEAVGNMWDNLTELSQSDPEKYVFMLHFIIMISNELKLQECYLIRFSYLSETNFRYKKLMEQSARENEKLNSTPLPHTCFTVKSMTPPAVLNKKHVRNL